MDCKDYVKVFKIPNSPEISGVGVFGVALSILEVNTFVLFAATSS